MEFQPPLAAFYSYAHKEGRDRRHLEELRDALAETRREELIDGWDDSKLRAGQQWEDVIIDRARQSRVFLLLLTNRFIASDFCVCTELAIARKLYDKRAAAIAPILAEDANWKIEGLRDLEVVMPFGKPVNRSRPSAAWTAVGQAVRQMVEDFLAGKYFPDPPPNLPAIPSLLPFTIGRETEIANFEKAFGAAPPRRPFVCVLTGHRQGQSQFVEQILSDGGPVRRALALTGANYLIEVDDKAWARSGESVESVLNAALASRVEPAPLKADREAIAASLNHQPGLTVFRCELSAAEWRACGSARLHLFLAYWAGWPDLESERSMIVFLSIQADAGNLGVPGVFCVPLQSVARQTVVDWLDTTAARRRFLVDRLAAHLGEVFAVERLPMEDFAARVLPFLTRFQI